MGSLVENKFIKDLKWPKNALLVAIKRGNAEIIPKGDVKLLNGDYLVVMVDERDARNSLNKLSNMASIIAEDA